MRSAGQQGNHFAFRQSVTKEPTLADIATDPAQSIRLTSLLHAFGHRQEPERMAETNNC